MILGIDPGVHTGWAVLDEKGTLYACGLGAPTVGSADLVVIEYPQIYPSTGTKQANDLVKVALRAGRYAERFASGEVLLVLPHDWKGSVPKPIHNRRVLDKLTPAERALAEGQRHDVIDAVGLAKYGLEITRRRQADPQSVRTRRPFR